VPDVLHPFFLIAKSIAENLRKSGYCLVVSASDEDPDLEEQEVSQLLAHRLDALIIASCRSTADLIFRIEKHNIPYVLIDRTFPGLAANFVGMDDEAVGRLATRHLIETGCRKVAHICGPQNSAGIRRFEGYKRELLEAGLKIRDDYVVAEPKRDLETKDIGVESMRRLLDVKPRPDGVFCFSDRVAMSAMNYAHEQDVRIPEDIAFIGCGNLHYDDALKVPLSSIDLHSRRIGEESARIALAMLNSKTPRKPESIMLKPELIVRASSQRRAARKPLPVRAKRRSLFARP